MNNRSKEINLLNLDDNLKALSSIRNAKKFAFEMNRKKRRSFPDKTNLKVRNYDDSDDSLESVDLNVTTSETETIVSEPAHKKDAATAETSTNNNNHTGTVGTGTNTLLSAASSSAHLSSNNLTADDEDDKECSPEKNNVLKAENKSELRDAFMLNKVPLPTSPKLLQCLNNSSSNNYKNSSSSSNKRMSLPINSLTNPTGTNIPNHLPTSNDSTFHHEQKLSCQLNQRNCQSFDDYAAHDDTTSGAHHRNSVFNDLLFEIYDRWHFGCKDSIDSDTFTDLTESDVFISRNDSERINDDKGRLNVANLMIKSKLYFN
ncbi:hypothetical protein HELRODRAFT_161632 [Helobdella robusta]|uniref:Uncharacterized protein n=1 Tax=Helobdella robusta TaxID=6412 RepID=T1ERQ6_HELRO|nr:hypothetical protein HELRODRAFT_161632 [Helobdella robusta]ESO02371.1 hypothetical protein HELRODRAFT_161632 [Helobdella robusta]